MTVANCSLEPERETDGHVPDEQFFHKFSYIFNTVPAPVLGAQRLSYIRQDAVLIDIASAPGGIDYAYCAQKGMNAKLCGGLPAKYAPKSAAKLLYHIIESYLNFFETI